MGRAAFHFYQLIFNFSYFLGARCRPYCWRTTTSHTPSPTPRGKVSMIYGELRNQNHRLYYKVFKPNKKTNCYFFVWCYKNIIKIKRYPLKLFELKIVDSIKSKYALNENIYFSHRIIDSFPQILKWKIIRLKPVFVSPEEPKARAYKTGINFRIFILIFVENCL